MAFDALFIIADFEEEFFEVLVFLIYLIEVDIIIIIILSVR